MKFLIGTICHCFAAKTFLWYSQDIFLFIFRSGWDLFVVTRTSVDCASVIPSHLYERELVCRHSTFSRCTLQLENPTLSYREIHRLHSNPKQDVFSFCQHHNTNKYPIVYQVLMQVFAVAAAHGVIWASVHRVVAATGGVTICFGGIARYVFCGRSLANRTPLLPERITWPCAKRPFASGYQIVWWHAF